MCWYVAYVEWLVISNHPSTAGGEGDSEHELLWHVVRAGEDLICAECGQVFRLVPRTEIPIMKTDML